MGCLTASHFTEMNASYLSETGKLISSCFAEDSSSNVQCITEGRVSRSVQNMDLYVTRGLGQYRMDVSDTPLNTY